MNISNPIHPASPLNPMHRHHAGETATDTLSSMAIQIPPETLYVCTGIIAGMLFVIGVVVVASLLWKRRG
ncbi:MAG: hypothetical protein IKA48_00230 [Fibrobacter sp.]|nr:hypothetical protein [Fibrobacter sp.]